MAFPESRRILALHLFSTPFLAIQAGVFGGMVPVLLRKHFVANEWQTTVASSALAVMAILAVFWNELYQRLSTRRYLVLFWAFSVLPLGGIAFCDSPNAVLAFVIFSAAGMGGLNPLSGDILRSCYPPTARSRAWSLIKSFEQFTIVISIFGVGIWFDRDPQAYRIYFALAVVVVSVGVLLLGRITREPLFRERLRSASTASIASSLRDAYVNMTRVLREDRRFRQYETAFCVYGLGWMICYAMVPFVQVDVLQLKYGEAFTATQVAFQLTMMMCFVPMGYVLDRAGPIRASSWAFGWLVLYPVLLMTATGPITLTMASIVYGLGMAAVNLAWTLGPVTLARNPADAPQYLAIHATLVSVRAILGQFPAVAIYWYTRSIYLPLLMGGAMFLVGAVMMRRLDHETRTPAPAPVVLAPVSEEPVGGAGGAATASAATDE